MSSVCSPTAATTAAAGDSIGGRAQRKLGCGPGISPKWNPRAGWVDLLSLSTVGPVKKIRNDTSQSTLNFYNSSSKGEKTYSKQKLETCMGMPLHRWKNTLGDLAAFCLGSKQRDCLRVRYVRAAVECSLLQTDWSVHDKQAACM